MYMQCLIKVTFKRLYAYMISGQVIFSKTPSHTYICFIFFAYNRLETDEVYLSTSKVFVRQKNFSDPLKTICCLIIFSTCCFNTKLDNSSLLFSEGGLFMNYFVSKNINSVSSANWNTIVFLFNLTYFI